MRSFVQIALLASAATAAVSKARRGAEPNLPFDPETSALCTWWHDNDAGSTTCEEIPAYWGITEEQWKRWNPSLGEACDGFEVGKSYCVASDEPDPDPPEETPTPTETPTATGTTTPSSTASLPPSTTTSEPGNGIETPEPIQPGMVDDCDAFHLVESDDSCASIADGNGITLQEFLEWNPEVGGQACTGIWQDSHVCISVIGHEPTPSEPDNGIETPQPSQPGMVGDCDDFHLVESGDSCETIADGSGISLDEFLEWNPEVGGAECTGIWEDNYVCISVIGHEPTPTDPGNGVETPAPIQDGMTPDCKEFHFIEPGQLCEEIVGEYGISLEDFIAWNPAAGDDCTGLWGETYACVAVL